MQIRSQFLDYFTKNDHKIMSSSPLVPQDASLLFANSGMVQFKDIFLGNAATPATNVTTAQKCVRAGGKHNDLENVGHTNRHHTFFEMLGNFSFGGYFKEQAILLAWNFLTKEIGLNKERLYVTVYHTDEEARKIWSKIIDSSRIISINNSDNFWQMGETGPCGPCSEIFYDYGDTMIGGLPGTAEQDGPRYTEVWNIVFMQNQKDGNGTMTDLPKKCIDTGMGLERITSVLEGKTDNYDTSIFRNIKNTIADTTGINGKVPSNIIADHIRASCFLISDGVIPSNEGRGYVLRRIIRRMLKTAYMANFSGKFLEKIAVEVESGMGTHYTELVQAKESIKIQLELEEERFFDLFPLGMKIIKEELGNLGSGKVFSGQKAFKLYDTYGFPLDLTQDILKSHSISVDEKGFDAEMSVQKQRSKASWSGSGDVQKSNEIERIASQFTTEFIGYTQTEGSVNVLYSDGNIVILNHTPFYAESGGQIADTGTITSGNTKINVLDVQKYGSAFVHFVDGNIDIGSCIAQIDVQKRNKIAANHTAAHLLHYALKKVLGSGVAQKGSLVEESRLRFDFSHPKPLTEEQINHIETIVNQAIIENCDVQNTICQKDEAIASGAMALFGEKYGDSVRVVKAGVSAELCGGTHTSKTGNIGMFKISSESSIASGVRRIEALTGITALASIQAILKDYEYTVQTASTKKLHLHERTLQIMTESKSKTKDINDLHIKIAKSIGIQKTNAGIEFIVLDGSTVNLASIAKERCTSDLIVINKVDGKFTLAIASNHKNALEILNTMKTFCSVSAGGNTDLVSGGGKEIDINTLKHSL